MTFYMPKDVTVRCDIPGCDSSLSDLTMLLAQARMKREGWTTHHGAVVTHECPNHTNPANVPEAA